MIQQNLGEFSFIQFCVHFVWGILSTFNNLITRFDTIQKLEHTLGSLSSFWFIILVLATSMGCEKQDPRNPANKLEPK